MSGPLPPDEPFISSYTRVLRGHDTPQHLIEAFPALEAKALGSASTLTDLERRQLLDLPDADEEAVNIRQTTSRSRAELLSAAFSPAVLSDDELALVGRRLWSPRSLQEGGAKLKILCDTPLDEATGDRIFRARAAAELPNEAQSFSLAFRELQRREQQRRDEEQSRWGGANQPVIPAWMDSLSRRFKEERGLNTWGFIALIDAEAQTISAERLDSFSRRFQFILGHAMRRNGAYAKLLNRTWKLFRFKTPTTVYVSLEPGADHSELRKAFRSLLDRDEAYSGPPGPDPRSPAEILQKRRGFLTNTFLVINKTCIDSVLDQPFLDDMRILAFEADFPQPNRTYIEGYQGWTWVRFEQLVYRFYGACLNENLGMDEIWKAAQGSKHGAFAALDPEVAKIRTHGTSMTGNLQPSYGID
jgi:hypothetical protein